MVIADRIPRAPGEGSDNDVDAVPDVEMFTLIEKELGSA
jgi:hypothetical protein